VGVGRLPAHHHRQRHRRLAQEAAGGVR
jgi:hypothetical protein